MFLGAGRGSLATQEFISKLLGHATIDKRTKGENRGGHNANSNLNYDRTARELMTAAEIGRMPKEKCIILLEGHQPIIDNKIRPFTDQTFLYAKSLGIFVNPVVVRETPGGYETIKAPGTMQPLNKESVAYCIICVWLKKERPRYLKLMMKASCRWILAVGRRK